MCGLLLLLLFAVLCAVLPNGVVTGLDIGLSNTSLVYITMSFYTMCKSRTQFFLLAFAFMWRLESWRCSLLPVQLPAATSCVVLDLISSALLLDLSVLTAPDQLPRVVYVLCNTCWCGGDCCCCCGGRPGGPGSSAGC